MKLTENPDDGRVIKLGDLRRLVKRADVSEFNDDAVVTFVYGRKRQAKLLSIEEAQGPGL